MNVFGRTDEMSWMIKPLQQLFDFKKGTIIIIVGFSSLVILIINQDKYQIIAALNFSVMTVCWSSLFYTI